MRINRFRATLVAALTLAGAPLLSAQRITLVHGFNSSGDTWIEPFNTRDYLASTYNIQVDNPSYPWYLPITLAAATLTLQDPANTILVGHSEGGVVSRRYAEQHQVAGIVTLGSPHVGANIATNYPMFLAQVGHTLWDIRQIFRNLWALSPPYWMDLVNRVGSAMSDVFDLLMYLINGLGSLVGYIPVVGDLQPNSPTFQAMNGGPGFVAEINNAPHRVSLTYQDPMYWAAPA
jgi:pimeloyl-ACP methyl ester carboxylesterase